MEILLFYHMLIMTNPYYVMGIIYLLGMLIQTLITSHFMRKRKNILIEEYGHTKQSIIKLYITSVILWPISWIYGIKSIYENFKIYRRGSKIERVDEE